MRESDLFHFGPAFAINEGETADTHRVAFSMELKEANMMYKSAYKNLKKKDFVEAEKKFYKAKGMYEEVKKKLDAVKPSNLGAFCSYLLMGPLQDVIIVSMMGGPNGFKEAIGNVLVDIFGSTIGGPLGVAMLKLCSINSINVKNNTKSSLNTSKVTAYHVLNSNIKSCDKMIQACKHKQKEK